MHRLLVFILLVGTSYKAWSQELLGLSQQEVEDKLENKSIDFETGEKNGTAYLSYIKSDNLAFAYQFDSTNKAIICMVFVENEAALKEVITTYNKSYSPSTQFLDNWSHWFNGSYATGKLTRNQGGPGKGFIHWRLTHK